MTITTTTIYNILQSELINHGKNEFFNDNQISIFKDRHSFMKKILIFDDDVEYITNNIIFHGLGLDDKESDKKFKRQFINRFLDQPIAQQTVETFSSMVSYVFLNYIDFLNMYYNNIDDFITGKSTTDSKGNQSNISDNRQANATLPQSEVNINVDNTILEFADDNNISRSKDRQERQDESESHNFNIETLERSKKLLEDVFIDFEKHCFIQVF